MGSHFHSLIPEIKRLLKETCLQEALVDTDDVLAMPYPYFTSGADKRPALYYEDAYFMNLGLIRMRMIDHARHIVENLAYLQRHLGHIPAANHRDLTCFSAPPRLPWMVRDVYRVTGDKEWLRRLLPDVLQEFRFWVNKPHTSITGLYSYTCEKNGLLPPEKASMAESGWMESPRFSDARQYNAIDLNALLYRHARMIYDFQAEIDGHGDPAMLDKAEQIKKLLDLCWNESEGFYFDNNFAHKRLSQVKTLAGFVPIFVELVDERRARRMVQHLKYFRAPGGLYVTDQSYADAPAPWNHPLSYAPYVYMTIKGLCDYELMEDAADIGMDWLNMVVDVYNQTGQFWEWYNARERTHTCDGLSNRALIGSTAGVYIAIIDLLGLD
jgi:alpha,alpha-trehalase